MENKKLARLVLEAAKNARVQPGMPLINYQPPGLPIVINPVIDNLNSAPDGIRPPETK